MADGEGGSLLDESRRQEWDMNRRQSIADFNPLKVQALFDDHH